jgi:hypothetical protein
MASREGPYTDATGTYYVVVDDAGKERREYVSADPATTSTTVDASGNIVQPGPNAAPVAAPLPTEPGGVEASPSGGSGGGSADSGYPYSGSQPARSSAPPSLPNPGASGGGGGGYTGRYTASPAAAAQPGSPPDLGPQIAGRVAGGLASLGPSIASAAGAAPRADGYQRPSISSDAGWAGPNSVGVFNGASVKYGNPQASSVDYPSGHPLRARAFDDSGHAYADHGSHTSPQYNALRAKGNAMAGKVRGMAANLRSGGGGGGGGSSGGGGGGYTHYASSSSSSAYPSKQEQRRVSNQTSKYYDAVAKPRYLPVKGILKDQGVSRKGAGAILTNPSWLLTADKNGILGHKLDPGTLESEELLREPMTDLAMITQGTQDHHLMSKTPMPNVPHILKKQPGFKPAKPATKMILDPSKVANEIAGLYRGMIGSRGTDTGLPDNVTLMRDLGSTTKKSTLGKTLGYQFKTDPGGTVDSVHNYITSAMMAGRAQDNLSDALSRQLDVAWANRGQGLITKGKGGIAGGIRRTVGSYFG